MINHIDNIVNKLNFIVSTGNKTLDHNIENILKEAQELIKEEYKIFGQAAK